MKKSYYLFSSGTLKRKDNTLCFDSEKGKVHLPVEEINEIYAFGEIDINKKLLDFLSQKKILLHYYNYYGYYAGTFYPRNQMNSGHILVKQVEYYLDSDRRLFLAKAFVRGAIENIQQVLQYYIKKDRIDSTVKDSIEELKSSLDSCDSINHLMSLEGHCRSKYYQVFDEIIRDEFFVFQSRTRRPPRNALNCLLSFGNTILYNAILSEVYKTHLDPRIGYLHGPSLRRLSLHLDVAEIFKPIIVDRIIFKLVGKKMISKKHFDQQMESVLIKENGKKVFIAEFDKRMETTIKVRELGRSVSYRYLIRLEMYKLVKHLLEEKEYTPFVTRW